LERRIEKVPSEDSKIREVHKIRKRLEIMTSLAEKICDKERRITDVRAVLLFGSVVEGSVHSESDLDIVLVKVKGDETIKRNKHERKGIIVDMWEHPLSSYENLFRKDWNPSAMFFYSIFLNILQKCEILYDPDGRFRKYKEKALKWSWPRTCKEFIKRKWERGLNTLMEIDNRFEKLAAMRRLFLVKVCTYLLELGRPVSIRNKDYYLIFSNFNKELSVKDFRQVFGRIANQKELEELVKHALFMFAEEVPEREPWTELEDARKHLMSGDPFLVALSLQNGAYYLGCRGLKNRGVRMEEKGYLWPESELELIEKARDNWPEFYGIYKGIHNFKSWRPEEVKESFEQIFL
jgi:predicted nucleotidyltransferase